MFLELINKIRPRLPSKLDSKLRPLWFFFQRLERGFDDSEIWSLDHSIALYTLPRLKRFKQRKGVDDWEPIINEMIWLFEQYKNNNFYSMDEKDTERAVKAKDLFGKYFFCLWW